MPATTAGTGTETRGGTTYIESASGIAEGGRTGLVSVVVGVVQPFTYAITNGVGAGFIACTVMRVLRGKFADIHPLKYLVTAAFTAYFVRGLYAW